jgi:hypothetical protein
MLWVRLLGTTETQIERDYNGGIHGWRIDEGLGQRGKETPLAGRSLQVVCIFLRSACSCG